MPAPTPTQLAPDEAGTWWAAGPETLETSGGLAASPLAVPAFFLGWIGIGVVVALGMARRGHDHKLMLAVGAGLGPLMVIVASDAVSRREHARPLVLAPGVDHGGDLDVVVLLQGTPEQVRSVSPTLVAVRPETGRLILARAVPYEWIDEETQPSDDDSDEIGASGDVENEVIEQATATLIAARDLVPSASPALVVFPGLPAHADRLCRPHHRSLVLTAIDDDVASDRG